MLVEYVDTFGYTICITAIIVIERIIAAKHITRKVNI